LVVVVVVVVVWWWVGWLVGVLVWVVVWVVWGDAYGVPLYQFPAISAYRRTVAGVSPSPLAPGVLWNIWAWKPVEKG
jgi:hypothetical protein